MDELERKLSVFRVVGWSAAALSVGAVLSVIVAVPLAHQQAANIRAQAVKDIVQCRRAVLIVEDGVLSLPKKNRTRPARQVDEESREKGEWSEKWAIEDAIAAEFANGPLVASEIPETLVEPFPSADETCIGCCLPGSPGPRGPPGRPGRPGSAGSSGEHGAPGKDYRPPTVEFSPPTCKPCPGGRSGRPGPTGPDGKNGKDGKPGRPGQDGQPGEKGNPGRPGSNGSPGQDGQPGKQGAPGNSNRLKPGRPGSPGAPGEKGPPGLGGTPGRDGIPGTPGHKGRDGRPGQDGVPGKDGLPGEPGRNGNTGERGICPKYCANDGGIFFDDGSFRK